MKIEILCLGQIDTAVTDFLTDNLSKIFKTQICLGEAMPLPEYAYNRQRQQYLSSAILERLSELKAKNKKILAVIDRDLYVPELNFVFGEADPLNGICIISITRLRRSLYGIAQDSNLFLKRTVKEAVHEIGHLFNLGHCPNPKCVMHFSNSLLDTDRKDYNFCENCLRLLRLE